MTWLPLTAREGRRNWPISPPEASILSGLRLVSPVGSGVESMWAGIFPYPEEAAWLKPCNP